MSKDVGYFPHYINARNDRKIRKARLQLGIESYAIYFMTLEVLREQKDYQYPLQDLDILADDFGTTVNKVEVIVMNYGLFEIDVEQQFFSPAQKLALKRFDEIKEINRLKGQKSGQVRRHKIQQQLEELQKDTKLSQEDSLEPRFNNGSTADELVSIVSKKVSKENKKVTLSINNFDSFVSHIRANFINQLIIEIIDKHTNKPIAISVSKKGYLYNLHTSEDFQGSRAKELWQSMYKMAQDGKLDLL